MSYCRWSSVCENNFESDLYIFDHVNGDIQVHIATSRLAGIENAPRRVPMSGDRGKEFVEAYLARNQWRKDHDAELKCVPIDLPYVGESREFTDPAELVAFLRELKELGYNMPDHVLDESLYTDDET